MNTSDETTETTPYNLEQIRDFWTKQALEHGPSPSASWSDHRVMELEIREILQYLNDGDKILDVGCANGYSTIQFASQKCASIRGIDYIPAMIEQAHQRAGQFQSKLAGELNFDVGNVMALDEPDELYDKVVAIRVIINLGEWELQLHALRECIRVLKPNGKLLLSEATMQGWTRMNNLRREWGLSDISIPAFNRYLDEEQVISAVAGDLKLIELANFSSTYFVGTRVIKPLLAKALKLDMDVANPDAEWNRWCAQLPAWGDYGTQKLFVFQKLTK